MMIQVPIQVPMWRCSDGKVCESAEEAREHERWLAWLALCLEFSIDSYDAQQMWERRSEFCEIADGRPAIEYLSNASTPRENSACALRAAIASCLPTGPHRQADMARLLDDLIGDLGKPA